MNTFATQYAPKKAAKEPSCKKDMTVPNMALTVQELIEMQKRGLQPSTVTGQFLGDLEIKNPKKLDLLDVRELSLNIEDKKKQTLKMVDAYQKAKEVAKKQKEDLETERKIRDKIAKEGKNDDEKK